MNRETFQLKGLNKPWNAAGFNSIYATVDQENEDWFHCAFDKERFSDERLSALFDLFKNNDDNLWSGKYHKVLVEFEGYSSGGAPIKPIIKELLLDDL